MKRFEAIEASETEIERERPFAKWTIARQTQKGTVRQCYKYQDKNGRFR